jgi:hypothetical protein
MQILLQSAKIWQQEKNYLRYHLNTRKKNKSKWQNNFKYLIGIPMGKSR